MTRLGEVVNMDEDINNIPANSEDLSKILLDAESNTETEDNKEILSNIINFQEAAAELIAIEMTEQRKEAIKRILSLRETAKETATETTTE